jgi:sensor domain CHASE-containing protein
MIGQVLQFIGILAIVLGLAASIFGAIWRYEFISDLRYDCNNLKEQLRRLEERMINEGKGRIS